MKTGLGFDIHRFTKDRKFMLGGVCIPYEKGLLGHSDGDALLHSLSDAILGAMGKPDIGFFFPDTDEKHKNIDSGEILAKVIDIMLREGYAIGNMDAVIICESPRLLPFFPAIRKHLANMLNILPENIGLKAKTLEGACASEGGDTCSCFVSVLLTKTEPA